MNEQLKVGDRARVVFNKEGRIYGGEGYLYENTSQILGAEGIVTTIRGDEITLTETRTTRLVMDAECLARVETARRTFEEIVNELVSQPCMSDWKVRFMNCGTYYADLECDYLNPLLIYTNGEVWWTRDERQAHLTAAQLAAISAACAEIAANYAAEHGKESKKNG